MNNEIKVSLNITLPGSVMLSQECAKSLEKEENGKGYNSFSMKIEYEGGDKTIVRSITVKTRKSRPASQSLNLGMSAYKYMISDEVPSFFKTKDWGKLSVKQRLEAHLEEISKELGGVSFSYVIL